jgi:DNA repair ATPase RecN
MMGMNGINLTQKENKMSTKRKISKKEELAYKLLDDQTQGREKEFYWFKYDWRKINEEHYAFNRYNVSCKNYYLTVDTRQVAKSFPEYLDLANKLNDKLELMRDTIDEINQVREQYINALSSHIKDTSKMHLAYEVLTDEEEKLIAEYQADPSKKTDLLNKIEVLTRELDDLPKGKANAQKRKELNSELNDLRSIYSIIL